MGVLHATAVRLDGLGVLIRGASGSGKSRLAMALLERTSAINSFRRVTDEAHQPSRPLTLESGTTALIGDDYLNLDSTCTGLTASPAKGLEGIMEVRGIGILSMPWSADAPVNLVVDLVPLPQMVRIPETNVTVLAGQTLDQLSVPIGDLAHQVLLVRMAVQTLPGDDERRQSTCHPLPSLAKGENDGPPN